MQENHGTEHGALDNDPKHKRRSEKSTYIPLPGLPKEETGGRDQVPDPYDAEEDNSRDQEGFKGRVFKLGRGHAQGSQRIQNGGHAAGESPQPDKDMKTQ